MLMPVESNTVVASKSCSSTGARLSFEDLAFSVALPDGSRKQILEPCSGSFEPGELVAIMGPSGSGKSTLLDMLAMKKTAAYTGEVLVNGRPRDRTLFPRLAAYVGQEDCMPEHWTVREALEFNARLKRRPVAGGRAETEKYVEGLLETFGLAGVAGTYLGGHRVRGVSGGQRRRVALARAVAARVPILFCDEPTSGLSATDAEACIESLQAIARQQRVLVLVNIHQPRREVAELFDRLLLLTSSPGRMVYQGPMAEVGQFLASCGLGALPEEVNVVDYLLDLVTPGSSVYAAEAMIAEFAASGLPLVRAAVQRARAQPGSTALELLQAAHDERGAAGARARLGAFAVPFQLQFRTLLRRKLALTFRNPQGVGMQLLMPCFLGLLVGTIFQGIGRHDFGIAQLQFFYILLVLLSLQSLPMMASFIEERKYMKHETSERLYRDSAHVLTTLLITAPLSLLGAILQTLIIAAMAELPTEFWSVILMWSLLAFSLCDSLFGFVAAVAADGEQAMLLATPLLTLLMIFNGVVVTRATAPDYFAWVFEVSPTFYALQATVLRVTEGTDLQALYMKELGYEHGYDLQGVAVVLASAVAFRLLQVLALSFLHNIRR